MLTYVFEHNDVPLYEQVYQCMKHDIITGVLQPGEKLPSKRTFATHNGISTITIQNAYDQLISEGYIYTIPKKGYYVSDIEEIKRIPKESHISLDIRVPAEPVRYDIDLSGNKVDSERFPFSVWAKLLREAMSTRSRELMKVSPTGGIYELRKAIAEYLKSFRGMLVDANQIVMGAGTEYLYGMLVQLLGNDREYCIENPGYKKLVQIYQQHQIICRYADMDEDGITVEGLRKSGADIAHISPGHHFPSGITMPAHRRYEVLAWANEKNGRYIIEDDYDSEFRPNGKPLPTLFSMDACEKVIYMNTFSKSLTPTIRISYMILPVHLANQFYRQLSFYSCTVSNFEQYTLAKFMENGSFEKHINRLRNYYQTKRDAILQVFQKEPLGKYVTIREEGAGVHFLMQIRTEKSEEEIVTEAKGKGIKLAPLSHYFDGEKDGNFENTYVINYSSVDLTNIEKAAQILGKIAGA